MKTKMANTAQKLVLLAIVAITSALFTGCKTSGGTGVSGHRGGIATGIKGTSRTIDPTSDYLGTRFEVWTKRDQIAPLNATINADHFVVDAKDDWAPITVIAIFPDGQIQKKTLNWTINGVGVTSYVGGNAGLAAIFGVLSIPSIAGDAISKAAYDIDLPRPHFNYLKVLGQADSMLKPPLPQSQASPAPTSNAIQAPMLGQQQAAMPTTFKIYGGIYGVAGQNVEVGNVRLLGGSVQRTAATPAPATKPPTSSSSTDIRSRLNSNPGLQGQ